MAAVVLVGAGLLVNVLARLRAVPLGLTPDNVFTMQISLPGSKYGQQQQRVNFFSQLLDRLRTVPGVVDAAAVEQAPTSISSWNLEIMLEGAAADTTGSLAEAHAVTPRYFQTMGIPLLQGRDFTELDRGDALLSLIVNEAFARRFWPNENPIGKRFRPGTSNPFGTVVGVVGNVRNVSLESEGGPAFYFSHGRIGMPGLVAVVRTVAPPETMTAALRAQVSALDVDLPVYNVRAMERLVSNAAGQPRFQTVLLGLFGAVALLLAAVGIYGVMAYAVTQRTHEIGVRMALGAQARDVLRLVVRQGMMLSLVGVAIGLALAFGLTRLLKSLLFGVSVLDPLTFVVAGLLLVSVALLACYVPAWRATKVDPLMALHYE
jgi:putative ABC transport system permease protein